MAVGARISSANLSGKTATVTFTPYTGQTSGSTVNLGTKVIPFNNITAHPYGDYSIYLPEYDYTYTINVPQPSNNPQTVVYVDRMVGSNNYGAAFLNFSDFTAEIIDLGVDSSYWSNSNVYPLQDSGYMYEFGSSSNGGERLVIFTNESGLEIGRYSGATDSYDGEALDGRIVSFEDSENGVLTYSNGTDVFTYTWDPQTHYIDIENDWYNVTSNNTFIVKKNEVGQWNDNGNGQSYLINGNDGTTTSFKTWTDGTNVRHKMMPNTDFIVVETQSGNTYTNLQICNASGTTLETISLTGATYTNREDDFLGSTKYCTMYYNYDDNQVDYKIIHYNGETETLRQTTHVRGSNFPEFSMDGDEDFWANDSAEKTGGVVITFYNNLDYSPIGNVSSYCDIMYMLDNQTTFNTYTAANNTEIQISSYGQLSNIYRARISTGDFFEILTISTTGGTITTTNIPISGITNVNSYYLGDRNVYVILTNDNNYLDALLINVNGSIMDRVSKTLNSSYSYSMNSQGRLGYLAIDTDEGDEGYYVYSGSTGFTSTDFYNNTNTTDTYYTDTFQESEVMLLYSEGSGTGFRVLSTTGITSDFQFPSHNYKSTLVGETKFMIVYQDDISSVTVMNLYNFSGQLLKSHETTYSGYDDAYAIGDRFFVKFNGDEGNEFFLVSEETITSLILDDENIEWAPNDYNWWEDD
jgi:hypothetical protein